MKKELEKDRYSKAITEAGEKAELEYLRNFKNENYKVNPSAVYKIMGEIHKIKQIIDEICFAVNNEKNQKRKYEKIKINKSISSDAYGYLKSLLHPNIKIVDLYVEGRWLKADLNCPGRYGAGITFAVKNQSID